MDTSYFPELPASRTPTSVIPTANGFLLCQSIDPLGLTSAADSESFAFEVRAGRSNQSPANRKVNSRRLPAGQTRVRISPEVISSMKAAEVETVPRENLDQSLKQGIQSPIALLNLLAAENKPKAIEPLNSSLRTPGRKARKLALSQRTIMDPNKPSLSPISTISSAKSSENGLPDSNSNTLHQISPDDTCIESVGSIPSSKTNSRVHRMAERVNKNRACRCCIFILAVLCAINIVFFLFAYDKVVEKVAASQLALHDSGVKYEAWTKTTVPVYYKVTIFNLSNPTAFMDGDRPRVHEIGPYIYRMTEEKVNVTFHDNGTVTYRSKPAYFFEPTLSSGSEDDLLWTVNIPFINAADAVKENPVLKTLINYAASIHNFETLQHLTVKELLWGHQSNVLDWGRMFQNLPYPHLHFGLLVGFNNSVQESYTMYTGVDDPHKMNAIHAWNGQTKLDFWSGESCNKIDGTDAGGFSPGVTPKDTLHIFNGQLCRSIPLVYQKSVRQGGIDAYRFVPPSNVFSYGPANPENMCFCSGGHCPPQGVLDMKPCYWGAAIAFSFPHFYQADPVLRHMVRGLRPDPSKHNTEFDIFPDLGIPLRVKLRMQMNVVLDRNQALNRARHYDLIYPIFWFEAGIDSLPTNLVEKLQMAQDLPPLMKTVFLGLCGVLTIVFFVLLVAQTVLSWCSSGLSSLRSLSSRESSLQDTRSNTPDLNSDHGREHLGASPISGSVDPPPDGSYRSFEPPHISAVGDVPVMITDVHTLLPPYRAEGKNKPIATISADVDRLGFDVGDSSNAREVAEVGHASDENGSPDYEASNDYPPSYAVAALPGVYTLSPSPNYVSVSVSAEVHHSASYVDVRAVGRTFPTVTETRSAESQVSKVLSRPVQDEYHQLEHKPLVLSTRTKPVQDNLTRQETRSPFRTRGPLATSSPHETSEDIQPSHLVAGDPAGQSRHGPKISESVPRIPEACHGSSTEDPLPRSVGTSPHSGRSPSRRVSQPPPLESDL